MHMRFDITKAIQAAAVIARGEGKEISRLRLLKLLYIADRRSLEACGRPIVGSRVVAMDNGPLHSELYDLIKGTHSKSHLWSRVFTQHGRDIRLTREPENSALSRRDLDILNETVEKYRDWDDWSLAQFTHNFEEWQKHWTEGTSKPIPLEDIVESVRGQDKDAILQDLKDDAAYDKFFSGIET